MSSNSDATRASGPLSSVHVGSVPRHGADTASRTIDDQAIVVRINDYMVHTLNPVGTRVWELADGRRTVAQIAATLSHDFDEAPNGETLERDALTFVETMVSKGLLELEDT